MYDEFFAKANELLQKGAPFATATVVRAEKPTSGKPGDKAIITVDGVMHGWIGGSCAQPTVVKEALKALAADESRLIRLSPAPDQQTPRAGLADLPMTCYSGGVLEIFIEPQQPKPRLLVIGSLPVAQALAHLGKAMNYHVIAVDPDTDGVSMAHAHEVITDLALIPQHVTPLTYVVVATHGNFDEIALEQVLRTHAPYLGLVASKRRAEGVQEYLRQQGFTAADLHAFKAPAGLDLHAQRGDEIALSIMAEIVQRRRTHELLDLALFQSQPPLEPTAPAAQAIDPVCHMTVEIATAKFTSVYQGETYYFCCAGCKSKFERTPAAYLHASAPDDEGMAFIPLSEVR